MSSEKFQRLLDIVDTLMGPNGCPWDQKATLQSLEGALLEEAHEVIEAIDSKDPDKIKEELGDLFFSALFMSLVAKKEYGFSLVDVIQSTIEKLIRRHPHVFGDAKINNLQELAVQWEQIKATEEAHKDRKSETEGIPKTLGALAKAQKVVQRLWHAKKIALPEETISEEELIEKILHLVQLAERNDLSLESTLQKAIQKIPNALDAN